MEEIKKEGFNEKYPRIVTLEGTNKKDRNSNGKLYI